MASPSVRDCLRGKHIFLTGASGFVGKCVVEKILTTVPDVAGIHVLIRPRKGSTAAHRLQAEVFESEIFGKQRTLRPDYDAFLKSKVHAIAGELTHEQCGMCCSHSKWKRIPLS